jgi:ankyrin repeat protein
MYRKNEIWVQNRGMERSNFSVADDLIKEIFKRNPDVSAANRYGKTALMNICSHQQLNEGPNENILIDLLEKGADVNKIDIDGNTALHYAASSAENAIAKSYCEMLLEFGADANVVNNAKKKALDVAVGRNNEPLVKLLLSKM